MSWERIHRPFTTPIIPSPPDSTDVGGQRSNDESNSMVAMSEIRTQRAVHVWLFAERYYSDTIDAQLLYRRRSDLILLVSYTFFLRDELHIINLDKSLLICFTSHVHMLSLILISSHTLDDSSLCMATLSFNRTSGDKYITFVSFFLFSSNFLLEICKLYILPLYLNIYHRTVFTFKFLHPKHTH